jgi:hypothetical protein
VERYSDPGKVQPKRVREPLSTVLTLMPEHFPEELYTAAEKKCVPVLGGWLALLSVALLIRWSASVTCGWVGWFVLVR